MHHFCLFRSFGTETKDKLPLGDFLCAVGQLKFRGTSVLFRLPHSCTQSLKRYVGIEGIKIIQSNLKSQTKKNEPGKEKTRFSPMYVFATRIVHFLLYLYLKFQESSFFLRLYRLVNV